MIKTNLALAAILSLFFMGACNGIASGGKNISTPQDSVSYLLGFDYGSNIAREMEHFPGGMNREEFITAFPAGFEGKEAPIAVENGQTYIMTYIRASQAAENDTTGTLFKPTNKDSVSSVLGFEYGSNISEGIGTFPGELDKTLFLEAFTSGFNGDSARLEVDDTRSFIMAYAEKAQEEENEKALAENKKFLDKNAEKKGVETTESGLQYSIITEGTGEKPTEESQVKVHYHGTLVDGTVFDSSVDRGEPATFGANQVIAGWTEALQLMPTGSKWKLYIPSELAYGANSPSPDIPANSILIFEVELLEIVE